MILNYDDHNKPNSARRFYELAPSLSDKELARIFDCSVDTVRRMRLKRNEKPITGRNAIQKRLDRQELMRKPLMLIDGPAPYDVNWEENQKNKS